MPSSGDLASLKGHMPSGSPQKMNVRPRPLPTGSTLTRTVFKGLRKWLPRERVERIKSIYVRKKLN